MNSSAEPREDYEAGRDGRRGSLSARLARRIRILMLHSEDGENGG